MSTRQRLALERAKVASLYSAARRFDLLVMQVSELVAFIVSWQGVGGPLQ